MNPSPAILDEDEPDVWYFSFGPNMSNNFFLGRREGDRPDQLIQRPARSVPGTMTSGLMWPVAVGPRPENGATLLQRLSSP